MFADLRRFLQEGVGQVIHELVGIVYSVRKLANDPDYRSLSLGLVQQVEMFAKLGNDTLVLTRITAEHILDHNDSLLHNIGYLRLDEVQQSLYAIIGGRLHFDRQSTN